MGEGDDAFGTCLLRTLIHHRRNKLWLQRPWFRPCVEKLDIPFRSAKRLTYTSAVRDLRHVLGTGYEPQTLYKTDTFKSRVNVRHEERKALPPFSPFTHKLDYRYVHPNAGAGMVKSVMTLKNAEAKPL